MALKFIFMVEGFIKQSRLGNSSLFVTISYAWVVKDFVESLGLVWRWPHC